MALRLRRKGALLQSVSLIPLHTPFSYHSPVPTPVNWTDVCPGKFKNKKDISHNVRVLKKKFLLLDYWLFTYLLVTLCSILQFKEKQRKQRQPRKEKKKWWLVNRIYGGCEIPNWVWKKVPIKRNLYQKFYISEEKKRKASILGHVDPNTFSPSSIPKIPRNV